MLYRPAFHESVVKAKVKGPGEHTVLLNTKFAFYPYQFLYLEGRQHFQNLVYINNCNLTTIILTNKDILKAHWGDNCSILSLFNAYVHKSLPP